MNAQNDFFDEEDEFICNFGSEEESQLEMIFAYENINEKSKKKSPPKKAYGKGFDASKLKKYNHYREEYHNCRIYKMLKSPHIKTIENIRKEYTSQYSLLIKSKLYPRFLRDYTRLLSLGIWFLEDNIEIMLPFLQSRGYIE